MADELKHLTVGTALTQSEYEAIGGHVFDSQAQGDTLYASSTSQLSRLAKDTNSTRVLTNTGTNNNPAWAQVVLTTGVSGTLPVGNGGTGATTLTDKAVLISQDSGTDTLGSVALTTSGQVIIGGASGPAAATLTAGSNVTITNGDGSISIAAGGGDFSNGGDNGALVLGTNDANSLTFETNNTARMVIASGGPVTMPTQPSFCAYLSANATDVTGAAGTAWVMAANTEDFDRGSNYNNTTYKFIAPVAGIYHFHAQAYMSGFPAGNVIAPSVWLYNGSTAMFQGGTVDTAGDMVSSGRVRVSGMMLLAVDDEITARVTATNATGGNVVDIQGGSTPRYTYFMGYLVS